jgi:DNA polymerase III subunit delta'
VVSPPAPPPDLSNALSNAPSNALSDTAKLSSTAPFAAPFADLIGQPQAVSLLMQAICRDRIAPGYLFVGPSGVGRARAAKAWAQSLLAPTTGGNPALLKRRIYSGNHPDLLWIEPTYLHQGQMLTAKAATEANLKRRALPQVRLEQIREVARFLSKPPLEAPRSLVVIENAELMAEAAANALLKTLEEPGQASIILIATDKQALLPTLISRTQSIPFVRLSPPDLNQVLTQLDQTQILENPDILALAQGSPGNAIEQWQQLQAIPPELLQPLQNPLPTLQSALQTARSISQTLDTEAQLWLLDYLQHRHWQHHWHQNPTQTQSLLSNFEQARKYLRSFVQPRLVWEITLMHLIQP